MKITLTGKVYQISSVQRLPIDNKTAWEFFSNPKNLASITPDKLNFRIISGANEKIYAGQIIQYKVNPFPIYTSLWVTEISQVEEGSYFIDEQRYGPYDFWHHKHFFKAIPGGTEIRDVVDFKVPFGWLGRNLLKGLIKRELKEIFTYRNNKLTELFGTYTQ